ncbi:MAG: hypothetical protein CMO01_23770 [Thalassobius sp.]|nr:hypothetical protein [Thalassovita sp.]
MEDNTAQNFSALLENLNTYTAIFSIASFLFLILCIILLFNIRSKLKRVAYANDIKSTNEGIESVKLNFTKQLEKFKHDLITETNQAKNTHIKEMEDLKSHLSNYNRNLFTRNTFMLDGLLELNTAYSQWINYMKNIYFPSITADTSYFEEIKKNLNNYRTAFGATLDNLTVIALDKEFSEMGKVLKKETQLLEKLTMQKLLKLEKLSIKYSIIMDTDKNAGVLREEERKKLLLEETEVKKEHLDELVSQYKKTFHVYSQFASGLNHQVNNSIS